MGMMLALMIVLPTLGAIAVALVGSKRADLVRQLSLWTTLGTLVLAVGIVLSYKPATFSPEEIMAPQMTLKLPWLSLQLPGSTGGLEWSLGIDGISLWLVLLTAVLMPSAVLISWTAINHRVAEYYAWLLVLQTAMLGVFCAFDLILFYVFFEFTLIPLFFLIGIWGGPDRDYAASKFFIYTLTGSVFGLVGLLAIVWSVHLNDPKTLTFSIPELAQAVNAQLHSTDPNVVEYWRTAQVWIFLALFAGFAIKVPLFPFHTWLPLAHVEAPTAGSVLLAGVLLKLGSYGFLRIVLTMLPVASADVGVPLVATLSVIGIIYGALCALHQSDIKRLVAYSSVSHLGFCMLGLFALNAEGIAGGTLQMINHGLSTGGLFLLVGMLYERYHTRQLDQMSGLAKKLPIFACMLVFMSLSSMGLPGLNGFVGETLSLIGMFKAHVGYAVLGALGIILGAWYLMSMLQKALFGPLKEPAVGHGGHAHPVGDLCRRELWALAPLVVLCVVIGVKPQPMLHSMKSEVEAIAHLYQPKPATTTVATLDK